MKYKFIILICFCSYVHSNYLDRDEYMNLLILCQRNMTLIRHIYGSFQSCKTTKHN